MAEIDVPTEKSSEHRGRRSTSDDVGSLANIPPDWDVVTDEMKPYEGRSSDDLDADERRRLDALERGELP